MLLAIQRYCIGSHACRRHHVHQPRDSTGDFFVVQGSSPRELRYTLFVDGPLSLCRCFGDVRDASVVDVNTSFLFYGLLSETPRERRDRGSARVIQSLSQHDLEGRDEKHTFRRRILASMQLSDVGLHNLSHTQN